MIRVTVEGELSEAVVDQEIDRFDAGFQKRGGEPLTKFERAILKTFLVFKLKYEHEPMVPTP